MSSALDISEVSVKYGRRGPLVVDRVSIQVGQGRVVGVVGESGSGKTSVAMVAAGLAPAASGTVTIADEPVTLRMTRDRRADVQVVFQDPHGSLDPRQSIASGLRELRHYHPTRTAWISDTSLLERVGLTKQILSRYPHQISGGQAQRVCIARALLLQPRVLIADEPTSALDVSVQAQILSLLRDIRDQEGVAMLFISHDLSVVHTICDEIFVMRAGKVVEHGLAGEILSKPQDPYTRALLDASPGRRHNAPETETA